MSRYYAESDAAAIKKTKSSLINKSRGGRPPKYAEPRRPITVTLPERILGTLESIDEDRSKAIVKCVEATEHQLGKPGKLVELIELTPGKALITVPPSAALRQMSWLRLVEISPLRYLLVLPPGTAVEVLEVAIQDFLVNLKPGSHDGRLLMGLLNVIRSQRREQQISTAEILLVDIPGHGKRKETHDVSFVKTGRPRSPRS